jgi:hypothetical protein
MNRNTRLERSLGWLAVPNLTLYLVTGQVVVWLMQFFFEYPMEAIALDAAKVAKGEVWRLFTFAFFPPESHPVFLIFAWYILFMMGTAMEQYWGSLRFTLYVFTGLLLAALLTLFFVLIAPGLPIEIDNLFISMSIFLAFAFVHGDVEFLLFFVIPMKVRWLAAVSWGLLATAFLLSSLGGKLVILAGVGNFFIFFRRELWWLVQGIFRGGLPRRPASSKAVPGKEAFHTCSVCGVTDVMEPDLHFVYADGKGICERCIAKTGTSGVAKGDFPPS